MGSRLKQKVSVENRTNETTKRKAAPKNQHLEAMLALIPLKNQMNLRVTQKRSLGRFWQLLILALGQIQPSVKLKTQKLDKKEQARNLLTQITVGIRRQKIRDQTKVQILTSMKYLRRTTPPNHRQSTMKMSLIRLINSMKSQRLKNQIQSMR